MAIYSTKEKYTTTINGKQLSFTRTWNGHRFTDEECERLAAGDQITITVRSRKIRHIVDVTGKLEEQTYNGHNFIGFKATKYSNERSDLSVLKSVLTFPVGITVEALCAHLEEQLENTFTSAEYYVSARKCEEFDNVKFYVIYLYEKTSFTYGPKTESQFGGKVFTVKDDRIEEYIYDSTNWIAAIKQSQYGKRYDELTQLRREERDRAEREAAAERERAKIAEIRAREWREIALNDYYDVDNRRVAQEWLSENYPEYDAKRPLFKYKTYSSWRNPSNRTIEDQSRSTYLVVPLIAQLPKDVILAYYAYPIASSYIHDATDYAKTIEPDTVYMVDYTLHGTD